MRAVYRGRAASRNGVVYHRWNAGGQNMDLERSKRIVDELTRRGAVRACPRCGEEKFEMVAETNIQLARRDRTDADRVLVVPAVMVACANCGYLSTHALASLGMMPEVAYAG
jgi:antirestriction protein